MNAIANQSNSPVLVAAPSRDDNADVIHLSEYLDILVDRKWLVAVITCVAIAIGVIYASLSTPIYPVSYTHLTLPTKA